MSEKGPRGLKRLRRQQLEKKPTFHCGNCGKDRYSPCTCQQKGAKPSAAKERA